MCIYIYIYTHLHICVYDMLEHTDQRHYQRPANKLSVDANYNPIGNPL